MKEETKKEEKIEKFRHKWNQNHYELNIRISEEGTIIKSYSIVNRQTGRWFEN